MNNEETIKLLVKEIDDLKDRLQKTEDLLRTHEHSGIDGTKNYRIYIQPEADMQFGPGFLDSKVFAELNLLEAYIVCGRDNPDGQNFPSSQFTIQHQENTRLTSKQTFFFAYRPPLYTSKRGVTVDVVSGETTMTDITWAWQDDELAGAYINVYDSAGTFLFTRVIASNTATSLTVTSAFTSTVAGASYLVYMPVYFGAAEYPWRRLYTTESTEGGIRFGEGPTAGGQNGLLYMDATGDIYWRNKSGTSTKLN